MLPVYPTAEVRWFFRGATPDEVHEWFGLGDGEVEQQAPRLDTYLRLPTSVSLGIKLRDGRLEIKQKRSQYGLTVFTQKVVGNVEGWWKWAFVLATNYQEFTDLAGPVPAWIVVKKTRWQRRLKVIDGQKAVSLPSGEMTDRGCEIEVTNILAAGSEWWSLSLEAFGQEATLHQDLQLVAGHLFTSGQAPILASRASYGYPRWLIGLE